MDIEYETLIVKSFVIKSRQERILFELQSTKRRKDVILDLCHNYREIFNEKYLIEIPKPNSDSKAIESMLKKHGGEAVCYAISFSEDIDGKHLPLAMALDKAVGLGMPSLISCNPGKLAYFEAEQSYGPAPRFLLEKL